MPLGVLNSAAFLTASQLAVAANATVEVRRESDSGLASIFSDRAGTAAITNPSAFADASGRFTLYVAASPGGFSIEVTSGAESFMLRNVPIGLGQEFDINEYWRTPLATASAAAARAALGLPAFTDAEIPMGFSLLNGYLDWSVAGNVLTVAVKNWAGADPSATNAVCVAFRSATPATGLPVIRKLVAATSISINDTALLGTINSTAFRLWCVAFDDGETVRLALINCLAGTAPSLNIFPLAGWGIASSTLEDNASDSAHVFYSAGAAVTAKAYATIGYATWEAGLATAGTWSAAPTRVQLFGPGVSLPGQCVQTQRTQTGAVASGATTIPLDDTIPQNTEGNEFLTRAITPSSAANLLRISSLLQLNHSTASANNLIAALFQDTTANALAVTCSVSPSQFFEGFAPLNHAMRAGTTNQTTMKMRAGTSAAATITFNGRNAAREFGGVMNSFLEVAEVMA